jgi:hypothetical protein
MRWLASGVVLAGLAAVGCVPRSSGTESKLAVVDRQFFEQCPFGVAQPSLTLVTNQLKWRQMLANARTAPPPFDATATSFDTSSVLILATRATGTPRTRLWVRNDAFAPDTATRGLQLGIEVSAVRPAAGDIEVTVVGMPCLVIWTSRAIAEDRVEARDAATGELLAEARGP